MCWLHSSIRVCACTKDGSSMLIPRSTPGPPVDEAHVPVPFPPIPPFPHQSILPRLPFAQNHTHIPYLNPPHTHKPLRSHTAHPGAGEGHSLGWRRGHVLDRGERQWGTQQRRCSHSREICGGVFIGESRHFWARPQLGPDRVCCRVSSGGWWEGVCVLLRGEGGGDVGGT